MSDYQVVINGKINQEVEQCMQIYGLLLKPYGVKIKSL